MVTGAGMPQITAIAEAARAAHEYGIPVIADGGIKYSGEITKAIAAGASSVMIGSLFAGVDESPGETILYQGRSFKSYRGMGSLTAMSQGSGERYFSRPPTWPAPSWAARAWCSASAPARTGSPNSFPRELKAACPTADAGVDGLSTGRRPALRHGLRGCGTIQELQEKAQFVRISGAGLRESHVHDVIITREAPNYRVE